MVTTPQNWRIWRVAATGRAAFMGWRFLSRATARKAAERWAGRLRRSLTFVHECTATDSPRPPRRTGWIVPELLLLAARVLFRLDREAWVETDNRGRRQWGWRLRDRRGRVVKRLTGRYPDRRAAYDAALRYFRCSRSTPVAPPIYAAITPSAKNGKWGLDPLERPAPPAGEPGASDIRRPGPSSDGASQ